MAYLHGLFSIWANPPVMVMPMRSPIDLAIGLSCWSGMAMGCGCVSGVYIKAILSGPSLLGLLIKRMIRPVMRVVIT